MKQGLLETLLVLTNTAALIFADPSAAARLDAAGNRELSATVKNIAGGLFSVKTEEGTTRYISVKEAERRGFGSLERGDGMLLVMDKGNQLIDIRTPQSNTGPSVSASTASTAYREVFATVKKINGVLISAKTQENTTRYFTIKEAEKNSVQPIKLGEEVLLTMDEGNQIIDIHRTQPESSMAAAVETVRPLDKAMTCELRTENRRHLN